MSIEPTKTSNAGDEAVSVGVPNDPGASALNSRPGLAPKKALADPEMEAFAAMPLRAVADPRFGSQDAPELSDSEISTHWSVPWADVMMTMMVLFSVLFVAKMAEVDIGEMLRQETRPKEEAVTRKEFTVQPASAVRESAELEKVPISAEEILRLSEQLVADANLEDIDVVLTDNQAIKVSVRGNLLFDLGKADLKPDAIAFLDKLAVIIGANNYQIEVVGHTDDFPISNPAYPTNWELSSARSARVARYLIQRGNLEPGRFTIIGHSFYRPSVANTSLENKARNRRVEIIITRNEYKP